MSLRIEIEVHRGATVECKHVTSFCVYEGNNILLKNGDTDSLLPMRSTGKPFILLPLFESENPFKCNLSDEQLSIMASSHNGELVHRTAVLGLLSKGGYTTRDLHCGFHLPYYEWLIEEFVKEDDAANKQLFHNCSGKHAAMLLMCKGNNYKSDNYWDGDHALQRKILNHINDYFFPKLNRSINYCLDGCGVPTPIVTLSELAWGYMKLGSHESLRPLTNAIIKNPYMIGGKERAETEIMKNSQLLAKSGSDGLYCICIPERAIGIALKVHSGNEDAAESAIITLLKEMNLISEDAFENLSKYANLKIYTSDGRVSGAMRPLVTY